MEAPSVERAAQQRNDDRVLHARQGTADLGDHPSRS